MLRVATLVFCALVSLLSCGAAKTTPAPAPTPLAAVGHKKLTIDNDRLVLIKGPITDKSADSFITDINNLDELDQSKPIYIIINSGGGSLDAGFRMQNNMDILRAPTVCVVEDAAYSMASAVFLHCGTRYMQPHSSLMFHFGSINLSGPRYEVKQLLDLTMLRFDEFDADNAGRLGMTLEEYRKWVEHDRWLTQDQALEMGIITDIVAKIRVKPPAPSSYPWSL